MKFAFLTFFALLFSVSSSYASDKLILNCYPNKNSPNGFSIKSLRLEISQEYSQAFATLFTIRGFQASMSKRDMDYSATGNTYSLTPSTAGDGDLKVLVEKKDGEWKATVTSYSVDTLSGLSCTTEAPVRR